jgi:hypothetical protein
MFERYTETARRTIFFARYEASTFGAEAIENHHLLLGMMREDSFLRRKLPAEAVRQQIEAKFSRGVQTSAAVDMPLSSASKRALHFAAEEAKQLGDKHIDTRHLALGLIREDGFIAELIQKNGIGVETLRKPIPEAEPTRPSRTWSGGPPEKLRSMVMAAENRLEALDEPDSEKRLAHKPWTRKEALGHLVDWATSHHQWFARVLSEGTLTAPGYPDAEWVKLQHYADYSWLEMVRAWVYMNLLIAHVLAKIPEAKLKTTCRIGVEPGVTLWEVITRYVDHCEEVLAQILTLG